LKTILNVLVGSRCHGLDTPESDRDISGVFVRSTSDLLRLDNPEQIIRTKSDGDDASWELRHFMNYCCKGNPTMLEALKAPVIDSTPEGKKNYDDRRNKRKSKSRSL